MIVPLTVWLASLGGVFFQRCCRLYLLASERYNGGRKTMTTYPFTALVERALASATALARQLSHTSVEPEHLLVGLTIHANALSRLVFAEAGLSTEILKNELGLTRASDLQAAESDSIPLSSHTLRAFQLANDEARSMNCNYLGVDHLTIGVLLAPTERVANVLRAHNITPDRARSLIRAKALKLQ
jgi:ATP-dependent Clp protease ATP-binding subunit ClpA